MRSLSFWGYLCVGLGLLLASTEVGCRRPPGQSASSTSPGGTGGWGSGSTAPGGFALAPLDVKLVEIELDLPTAVFRGTPQPTNEPNVEPAREGDRPPLMAPEGTINLAQGRPVTCSDPMPTTGEIDFVTDGDKTASDMTYLGMKPGTQWVQIDLGQKSTIYAVLLWHRHTEARVYRDVIVQVSDDPDFIESRTVFNNDHNNTSGMGIGPDQGYIETSEGKLIDCGGVEGRYVRLTSRGNHMDEGNDYTEVEVFGLPGV